MFVFWNAFVPMKTTVDGMFILLRLVHPLKQNISRLKIPFFSVTDDRELHPLNAYRLIFALTLISTKLIVLREIQFSKQLSEIILKLSPKKMD